MTDLKPKLRGVAIIEYHLDELVTAAKQLGVTEIVAVPCTGGCAKLIPEPLLEDHLLNEHGERPIAGEVGNG